MGMTRAKTPFFRAAGARERQLQNNHTTKTAMSVVVGAILVILARQPRFQYMQGRYAGRKRCGAGQEKRFVGWKKRVVGWKKRGEAP